MSFQKYSIVVLATPLLVAVSGRLGLALSLTPSQPDANQEYQASVNYSSGGGNGQVSLYPSNITTIRPGGTDFFRLKLATTFPDWTFKTATKNLAGTFSVEVYAARYRPIPNVTLENVVAAEFLLQYHPYRAFNGSYPNPTFSGYPNPTPQNNDLHWIQLVTSNHGTKAFTNGQTIDLGHGTQQSKIDAFFDPITGRQPTPYYTFASTSEDTFYDIPYRSDITENHNWSAQLYLVEQTAPKTVTIYNGISWGWTNTFTPSSERSRWRRL